MTRVSQSLKVVRLRLPRKVKRLQASRVLPIILLKRVKQVAEKVAQ